MENLKEIEKKSEAVIIITANNGHINLIVKGEKSNLSQMLARAILSSNGFRQVLTTALSSVKNTHRRSIR